MRDPRPQEDPRELVHGAEDGGLASNFLSVSAEIHNWTQSYGFDFQRQRCKNLQRI
jgi:hypothetical protein